MRNENVFVRTISRARSADRVSRGRCADSFGRLHLIAIDVALTRNNITRGYKTTRSCPPPSSSGSRALMHGDATLFCGLHR